MLDPETTEPAEFAADQGVIARLVHAGEIRGGTLDRSARIGCRILDVFDGTAYTLVGTDIGLTGGVKLMVETEHGSIYTVFGGRRWAHSEACKCRR